MYPPLPELFVAHCLTVGVQSGRRVWMILGRGTLSSWSLSSRAELSPCSSSQTWTTTLGVVEVAVWSSYFSPGNHTQNKSRESSCESKTIIFRFHLHFSSYYSWGFKHVPHMHTKTQDYYGQLCSNSGKKGFFVCCNVTEQCKKNCTCTSVESPDRGMMKLEKLMKV